MLCIDVFSLRHVQGDSLTHAFCWWVLNLVTFYGVTAGGWMTLWMTGAGVQPVFDMQPLEECNCLILNFSSNSYVIGPNKQIYQKSGRFLIGLFFSPVRLFLLFGGLKQIPPPWKRFTALVFQGRHVPAFSEQQKGDAHGYGLLVGFDGLLGRTKERPENETVTELKKNRLVWRCAKFCKHELNISHENGC